MAASSPNSWVHTSLMSPLSQTQSSQHALYTSDLPMHPSSHLNQNPNAALGQQGHPSDTFCQPLHTLNPDFRQSADSHQLQKFSGTTVTSSSSGRTGFGAENAVPVTARKVHKADREKLRRDRLNEQFAELAGVLDPDRPKNDKANILGDSVQVVRELRAEVKRLKTEQASLLDESRDLTQEKTELREEKAVLKSETEQLQGQVQQRLRFMVPWMPMDPSLVMGAPAFPYPLPVPQPVSAPPPDANQGAQPQGSLPQTVVGPGGYIPLAPAAPGAFAIHPALQTYSLYGNRPGDGSNPYISYPHYSPQVSSHSHVERPYPQYPSPVQPLPGYLMHMQPPQGQPPISGQGPGPPIYRASYAPGSTPSPQQTSHGHSQSAQTTSQLHSPVESQLHCSQQAKSVNSPERSSKAQSQASGSASSGHWKDGKKGAARHNSLAADSSSVVATTVGANCSPGVSSTCTGVDSVDQASRTSRQAQKKQTEQGHDPTLRPPVA